MEGANPKGLSELSTAEGLRHKFQTLSTHLFLLTAFRDFKEGEREMLMRGLKLSKILEC